MRGRVVSWTRPRLQQEESKSDGSGNKGDYWVSELVLETADGDEQKIRLNSDSAEDHLWITEAGSWIQLQVPANGPLPVQQSTMPPPPHPPLYVNMDEAMQVVGLVAISSSSAEQSAPTVILETSTTTTTTTTKKRKEVLCLNAKVWSELVRAGIGSWIRLYNVKRVQLPPAIVIAETSGMRTLSSPPASTPTPLSQQVQIKMEERKDNSNNTTTTDTKKEVDHFHITNKHGKWECLNCGWLNFPTKTACGRCDCNRRMEDSLPATWIPRKVKQSWSCRHCPFSTNFFDSEWCWQCGRKRTRTLLSKP